MSKTKEEYFNERKDVSNKILNILQINESNKIISLKSLDNNKDVQNQILALESDIKKFFICSRWTFFNCKNRKCKRSYLSLIKAIMKVMDIKITSSTLINKIDDGKTSSETFYNFHF